MKFLNLYNPFRKITADELRQQVINDYERELINAENTAAYSRKMAEFYQETLLRLRPSKEAVT